jgi:dTDP-4-amino-4,6-dideoxygalactose transaminase
MEFCDLSFQQERIRKEIETNINTVLSHGKYIMGPEVSDLEEKLASFVGSKHAIACASGTDALLLILMAYNIKPGDAIFTTPFTFIATAEVISLLGAIPIFVDIDPVTFNIDPNSLELAILAVNNNEPSAYPLPGEIKNERQCVTPKGIITVDLFGLPADYDRINDIAKKYDLFVIEDAAQSFGSVYKSRKACALSDVGCTSFFPAKPLGCYGDGGMCFTDNDHLCEVLRSLLAHGKGHHKYDNVRIGINGRLDTLQAAILLAKFKIFPEEVKLRQEAAQRYNDLLGSKSCSVIPPQTPELSTSAWAQYCVLAKDEDNRKILQTMLKENDIPTAIYYPRPLHLQTAFNHLDYKEGDFPISEDYARRIFGLPMHPYLKEEDQKKIAQLLSSISG